MATTTRTQFPENNLMSSKLDYFINIRKIPNIIFHGSAGCGKRTIVGDFINRIYHFDRSRIKNYVMFVNCAHGKGIKFIRDELKQFAKTNIQCNENNLFKSIVMYNADELTIDAQSALRRCIELFSHTTRFFIVVENKHKLLKPILSRFCEIYIPDKNRCENETEAPIYQSLHTINIDNIYGLRDLKHEARIRILTPEFQDMVDNGFQADKHDYKWFMQLSNRLYESGISCLDILQFFESHALGKDLFRVHFVFHKIKSEFRCEKMLMMYLFDYMFLRSDRSLKNVSFL
jgi:hypothetical protein